MNSSLLIILSMLAVWRATHMIVIEDGPLAIFPRLQAFAAKMSKRRGGLFDLVSCFYCVTVWVSFMPAFFLSNNIGTFILLTLSLSGGAIVIQEIIERLVAD